MVSFTTSPQSSGTKYQVVDTGTKGANVAYKVLTITDFNGNVLFTQTNIPIGTNLFSIDVTPNWTPFGLIQIGVSLSYIDNGGGGESLQSVFLLPTTLNLKQG